MPSIRYRETKEPKRIHLRHDRFDHLTMCGAGAINEKIGNIKKAKHPCITCEKGARR